MIQKVVDAIKSGHAYITNVSTELESVELRSLGSATVDKLPVRTITRFEGVIDEPYLVGEQGAELVRSHKDPVISPSCNALAEPPVPSSWVECGHCRAGYERSKNGTCPQCGAPFEVTK